MNNAEQKTAADIVEQMESLFPLMRKSKLVSAGYQVQTEEDRLEADHIRVESHSSRFI